MLRSIQQKQINWFFLLWTLLNLGQAFCTQLLDDEAYYWVYSRFLDWGYFDHPPMIAVLIKIGYALFQNELGLRLFMVLMNSATLYIVYRLLREKDDQLFMLIMLSMGVLQVGGILAVPDIPLTFFTALFFWQYKRFLEKDNWQQALLLGLVMALMLYSKYHGILIIFFCFLSNLKLLSKPTAWLAATVGVILFSPHIWWQYTHGFPSVLFHLKERNATAYRLDFTLEYLGGQLLIAGPLIGWVLFYAAGRFRPRSLFEKSLQYSLVGFYLFFLLSTLKGRVEANWTVPALVPLIILAHAWLTGSVPMKRWIYRLWIPSLLLAILARGYMAFDIPALNEKLKDEMHNNLIWSGAIKAKADGLPVVFFDSYQRPSKYWFYTGDTAFGLNTTQYRRNNFNFWPLEKQFQGKTVLLVDKILKDDSGAVAIPNPREFTAAKKLHSFESHSGIELRPDKLPLLIKQDSLSVFTLQIKGGLAKHETVLDIFDDDKLVKRVPMRFYREGDHWLGVSVNSGAIGLVPGTYRAKLGILSAVAGIASQNSPTFTIRVLP